MARKIEKRCSTCDHWLRVSMPADVGVCIPTCGVHTGDDCCEQYVVDPMLKPARRKPARKEVIEDGEKESDS